MSVATPVIDYIDGETRRIYLLEGVDAFHWIEDIYREYINRRNNNEALRNFYPLIRSAGNEPKGGGKFTPRYVTMIRGCRVIPFDENIYITVTGEAITDNADIDPDPFDTSTRVQPLKLYITPPAAEIVRDEVSLAAIAFMSFDNRVSVDVVDGDSIAGFPGDPLMLGNNQYPVASFEEALIIANYYGITSIKCVVSGTISLGNFDGFHLCSDNHVSVTLTIEDAADVGSIRFDDLRLEGVTDGISEANNCIIGNVSGFNGHIHNSSLSGTLTLGGIGETFIRNSTRLTSDIMPVIDFDNTVNHVVMSSYTGMAKFINMTDTHANAMIGLEQGVIMLDTATVTAGTITAIGIGYLRDELGNNIPSGLWNGVTVINNLINNESIGTDPGSTEAITFLQKIVKNKRIIDTVGSVKTLIVYDDDNTTPILTKTLKDPTGSDISDLPTGALTQENKTSV